MLFTLRYYSKMKTGVGDMLIYCPGNQPMAKTRLRFKCLRDKILYHNRGICEAMLDNE